MFVFSILESYPLRGYILGSGANANGASGWTHRRESGNNSLDCHKKCFIVRGLEPGPLILISTSLPTELHWLQIMVGLNPT